MQKSFKIFYRLIILLIAFNCLLQIDPKIALSEPNLDDNITETIQIGIQYEETLYFRRGVNFYFNTDFNDNETNYFNASDIEEKTIFKTEITYTQNYHTKYFTAYCRLWKPSNDNLKLLCVGYPELHISGNDGTIKGVSFTYKSYQVSINPPLDVKFKLNEDYSIPFIYADEQKIKIEEDKEFYELKFNIRRYNDELLYLFSNDDYIILDKCSNYGNYLICQINKEEIEEPLSFKEQVFDLYSYYQSFGLYKIDLVYNITIYDEIKQKQEIYVQITKLLNEVIDRKNYVAYETNITNISSVLSNKFTLKRENGNADCFLKKAGESPLLLICYWSYDVNGENILGEIKDEIILNDINIKYNFRIQPCNNIEIFFIYGFGSIPIFVYPKVLNFSLSEKFTISYIMREKTDTKALKLIPHFGDMNCPNYYGSDLLRNCEVNRSYFKNEKTGYYNTYHLLYANVYTIFYDFSPIQVIIPDDKRIYIKVSPPEYRLTLGQNGTLFLDTNYNDKENNILDPSEIEENTFLLYFNDSSYTNVYYRSNCRLWKPNNNKKNINLICNFNFTFSNWYQGFKIKESKFNYREYTFIFNTEETILAYQAYYSFPFLYSEEQLIMIDEEIQEYNLQFKIVTYNYEDLFLSGSSSNYIKLEKCEVENITLTCKISKQKLKEVLILNKEQFNVISIDDEGGTIPLNYTGLITVYYDDIEKEDIYVEITKLLNNITEQGVPVAFETNITDISNLKSNIFSDNDGSDEYCYFKKTSINPLLLLCVYPLGFSSFNKTLENETILDNIHYKYNFIIKPYNITTNINIGDYGTGIYLAYPAELNYVLQNSFTIRFILGNPLYTGNIALIYNDSNYSTNITNLYCENSLNKTKKCIVPISYFVNQNNKESEFSYVYHSYSDDNLNIDYGISAIHVTLPDKIVVINIDSKENSEIKVMCQNTRISFITNYDDPDDIFDASTIEEKTFFKGIISIKKYNGFLLYNITCRLWKPKNKNIIIICEGDNTLNLEGQLSIQGFFNETAFDFNDYRVIITPDVPLSFQVRNQICPFLYAEQQNINIEENDKEYELIFKIETYNKEPLLISNMDLNFIILDDCSIEKKNLICKLDKNKLLEQNNNQTFKVYYYDQIYGFPELHLIFGISFNSNIEKENIYVNITNLLQSNFDYNNYVAYETNVTDISNVITDLFLIDSELTIKCFLKKSELSNLLMLCQWNASGNYSLGEIKNQMVLGDIHIKYNFIILPVENTETFSIKESGSLALFVYPPVLDFYKYNSTTFDIMMQFPENTNEIMLNSCPLECNRSSSLSSPPFKRCSVKIEYFNNYSDNQYFYIQHGTKDSPLTFYELTPILIKKPKNNDVVLIINKENNMSPLKIGQNGVLYFVTNYYDSQNIFNYTDIEEVTSFDSKAFDEDKNEYDVKCRLWKSSKNNYSIRTICRLKENLKFSYQKIKLKDFTLNYNDSNIYIISNDFIEVNQVNFSLSFLYSDEQNISIDNSNLSSHYYLNFKYESYNNDKIYLYGTKDNYAVLDECIPESSKILTCKITNNSLDEIMALNDELFSVGAINDNLGVYKFNNILKLQIHYSYYPRQKSKVNIVFNQPFGEYTEVGVPFGFITSNDYAPNLITERFDKYCYFRKFSGFNLLYVCKADSEQTYYINQYQYGGYEKIHWKYNFEFRQDQRKYFYIQNKGLDINFVYPQKLDFVNNDNVILRYIIPTPSINDNIRLNPDLQDLNCKNLEGMKLCNISSDYFKNRNTAYYYTYLRNSTGEYNPYYSIPPIDVIFPNDIDLTIDDKNNEIQYLGKDNILYFVTNYIDSSNVLDTSGFSFDAKISNNKTDKVIDGTCNLWEPNNKEVRIICKLKDKFEVGDNSLFTIYLNKNIMKYKNYIFTFGTNAKNLYVMETNSEISFLYSDPHSFSMNTYYFNIYELNFKKESYYDNQLILYNDKMRSIYLDCSDKGIEVTCNITAEKVTQILVNREENFKISQIINSLGIISINSILDITIEFNNYYKNDVELEITKLLTPVVERNTFIAYETKFKYNMFLPPITTGYFSIQTNSNNNINCLFKKNKEFNYFSDINENFLLLCLAKEPGENYLNNLSKIEISDINILYKFILTSNNTETFTVNDNEGSIIYSVYPDKLDFNEQDSFIIQYITDFPERLTGIKLNINAPSDLECTNKIGMKECVVYENHFTMSGEYHTYRDNSIGNKSISYEVKTINVTLKESDIDPESEEESESDSDDETETENESENENNSETEPDSSNVVPGDPSSDSDTSLVGVIVGSVIGGLVIIALVIFLIWRWKRKAKDSEINLTTKELTMSNQVELVEKID